MRHLTLVALVAAASQACGEDPKPAITTAADTAVADTSIAPPDDTTVAPPEDVANGDDGATTDTADAAAPDAAPSAGGVGDRCETADDCAGADPKCLALPGGYCAPSCANAACPDGSVCYTFQSGDERCLKSCDGQRDCRTEDEHICDTDGTCWWYDGTTPGASPIGGPCQRDEDCIDTGATCYREGFDGGANGFIGGYCMIWDCTTCPDGARCISVTSDGTKACFADCAGGAACPQTTGYVCSASTETCWPGCESDADCPDGYGCSADVGGCAKGYTNAAFVCDDQRHEQNDVIGAPADVSAPLDESGLDLCKDDDDWYRATFAKGTLGTVGIDFPHLAGDLDLIAYDENGELLGSRVGPENYGDNARGYENSVEYHSILSPRDAVTGYFRVRGYDHAQNEYAMHVTATEWSDGLDCTATYGFDECRGWNGTSRGILYHFPFARPDDPYVPSGYVLESYSQYRWLRRETIMLVRYAIHEVQKQFRGTTSLGLIDMGDMFGVTPGFDVGDPRHPESTHDQGGNIDIAYYQTDGENDGQIVCGANESADNDGYYCTSVDHTVLDVERTTYFIAMLNQSARVRVIGVDQMLAPLIEAEAKRQRDAGIISDTLYQRVIGKLAYGEGWPFHHHHLHLSMRWWSQDDPQPNGLTAWPEPPVGCGYRMPGDGPL